MSNAPAAQSEQRLTSTEGPAPRRNDLLFALLVAVAYLSLLLIQLTHHVMWRDEIRPWQIIGQCSSVSQMIAAMRYDAVPPLWNLIVYGLTRLTDDPRSMQIVHSLIATGVVFVFAMWGPFPRWIKLLFPLGYFPLFEYGVLARNYSLLFLFLLIACVQMSKPRLNVILLAIVVAMMGMTSIWGGGFAGAIIALVYVRFYARGSSWRAPIWQSVFALLIVLAGAVIVDLTVRPGPGASFAPRNTITQTIKAILPSMGTITRAWLPIPQISPHFWNTNFLDSLPIVQILLGIALLALVGSFLRGAVALLFYASAFGLIAFESYHAGSLRHQGHLFMLLVVSFWLAETLPPLSWNARKPVNSRRRSLILGALLAVQAVVGAGVAIACMRIPFSASRDVARLIQESFPGERVVLVGIPDYCVSPISQWLGRPIYFPDMKSFARVNTQDDAKRPGVNGATLLPELYGLIRTEHKPAMLIAEADFSLVEHDTTLPIDPANPDGPALSIRVLPEFPDSIVATEAARLYLINLAR